MEPKNLSQIEKVFTNLKRQYTILGSLNSTINSKRSRYFENQCNQLNELYHIPSDYCPFYWDDIACWNATPPYSSIQSPCVSWPISKYPPKDAMVERRCLGGYWENMTERSLEMLYKSCNPHTVDENYAGIVLTSRYVALLGYCSSAFVLLFALFVFLYLKKLKCGPNRIHFNLFIAFFLRFLFSAIEVIYAVGWRGPPTKECTNFEFDITIWPKLFAVVWNYSILASYGWVFIEGLYLHNSIYFNVFQESRPIQYIVGGWVVPLFIIIIWSLFKATIDNTKYWMAYCDKNLYLIQQVPLIIIVVLEVICTVNIMRQLHSKVKNDSHLNERARYRKFARSFLFILLSIGGTHFIFDIVLHSANFLEPTGAIAIMIHCIYIIINSIWGFVISYIYCFNNAEIRSELWKRIKASKTKGNCPVHTDSPISLSTKIENGCAECALNKKLLELHNYPKMAIGTDCSNTVCSTIVNSEQNTVHKIQQRIYPRVTYLSFCREEADENS
uniref:Uncharacterized protein n=1 Tax=Panagrolaimus sp. JU765 TaxID=591449 RepID=A0AC34RET1_9BILA